MTKLYFDLLNSPAEAHSSIQKSLCAGTLHNYSNTGVSIGNRIRICFVHKRIKYRSTYRSRIHPELNECHIQPGRSPGCSKRHLPKIHETTLRTPVEMGVRPNSITLEEYQIAINQQAISMVKICRMETKVRG